MAKANHKSRAEQIENKEQNAAAFRQEKAPFKVGEAMKPEDASRSVAIEDSSIRMRAYLIHSEKGGLALDNWLEAERILKNGDAGDLGFINEGNPNTQSKEVESAVAI